VRLSIAIPVLTALLLVTGCQSLGLGRAAVSVPATATLGDVVALANSSRASTLVWERDSEQYALQSLGLGGPLRVPVSRLDDVTHALLLWGGLVVIPGDGQDRIVAAKDASPAEARHVDRALLLAEALPPATFVMTTCPQPGEVGSSKYLRRLAEQWGVHLSGVDNLVLAGPADRVTRVLRAFSAI
jgi:hypothetical protein